MNYTINLVYDTDADEPEDAVREFAEWVRREHFTVQVFSEVSGFEGDFDTQDV